MPTMLLDTIIRGADTGLKMADRLLNTRATPQQYAEAVGAIQKAAIKTRMFIAKEGYVPSEEISLLWIDAMQKAITAKIDDGLPDYLISKARYWSNPELWLRNPESMKLVPKLTDLEMKCDMLLLAIRR